MPKQIEILQYKFVVVFQDNDKEEFPVSSYRISAGVNSIPTLTASLTVGRDIKSRSMSPIQKKIADLSEANKYVLVKLRQKNSNGSYTDQFIGILDKQNLSYEGGIQAISITCLHWIALLDAIPPVFSAARVESGNNSLLNMLVHTGQDNNGNVSVWTFEDMKRGEENALKHNAAHGDFISGCIVKSMKTLCELGTKLQTTIFAGIGSVTDKFPAGYEVDKLLEKIKPFDIMKIPGRYSNISDSIVASLLERTHPYQQKQSLWQTLLAWSAEFYFVVIPQVDRILITPRWPVFKPADTDIPNIKIEAYLSAASVSSNASKFGRVCIPPAGATSYHDLTTNFNKIARFPDTSYHGYPDYWTTMPRWMYQQIEGALADTLIDPAPEEYGNFGTQTQIVKQTDKSAAAGIAAGIFFEQLYSGSALQVTTKLDFDICPGSMVSLLIKNPDETKPPIHMIGYVLSWDASYDGQTGAATRQLRLSYCRPADSPYLKQHPLYETKTPFIKGVWY